VPSHYFGRTRSYLDCRFSVVTDWGRVGALARPGQAIRPSLSSSSSTTLHYITVYLCDCPTKAWLQVLYRTPCMLAVPALPPPPPATCTPAAPLPQSASHGRLYRGQQPLISPRPCPSLPLLRRPLRQPGRHPREPRLLRRKNLLKRAKRQPASSAHTRRQPSGAPLSPSPPTDVRAPSMPYL